MEKRFCTMCGREITVDYLLARFTQITESQVGIKAVDLVKKAMDFCSLDCEHTNDEKKYNRQNPRVITAKGTKLYNKDSYLDGGISWWVFERGTSDMFVEMILNSLGVDLDGVPHYNSMYDCTGRYSSSPIQIKRTATRVLVTQSWNYDV